MKISANPIRPFFKIFSILSLIFILLATFIQIQPAAPAYAAGPGPTTFTKVFTTTNQSWTVPWGVYSVEVLVVGGGGGGGGEQTLLFSASGGGGAGQVAYQASFGVTPNTSYKVTVGNGGSGGSGAKAGANGSDSSFIATPGGNAIYANGGGGGGTTLGLIGGCGGGGAARGLLSVYNGSIAYRAPWYLQQGYRGGNGFLNQNAGGGGGGMGAAGANGASGKGGNGGTGTNYGAQFNTSVGASGWFGGGGGGGAGVTAGTGGTGGGAKGGVNAKGANAQANTGGGGGGTTSSLLISRSGGNGGSGIVIIKYTQPASDYCSLTTHVVGNGTITTDTSGPYYNGSYVWLTAAAAPGWTFSSWSDALSGNTSPVRLLMNSDKSVTATFTQNSYTLTINKVGNGSFTPLSGNSYLSGTVVMLNAMPDAAWGFLKWEWTGGGSSPWKDPTITMNGNVTATVTFYRLDSYTLTTSVVGVGGGRVDTNTSNPHEQGSVVQLTAIPFGGWTFASWSGNLSGSTNPTTITMDGNKSVTATFTQNSYTLTINKVGNGSFTPDSGNSYLSYQRVDLSATPGADSYFAGWSGGITNSSASTTILMDSAKSVTANFNLIIYPNAISDLAIMPENQGGINYDSIRLTWTSPSNVAVDSYQVRRSASVINDGNWDSATPCDVRIASIKGPGATQTCTVTGLTEGTTYYFAVKSSAAGYSSGVSNSPSATARQPKLGTSDWWLYQIYYNDAADSITNTVYEIDNVRAVDQTAIVDYTDMSNKPAAFTSYSYSPAAIIDQSVDESKTSCTTPARARVVDTFVTGTIVPATASNTMQSVLLYVKADDPTLWLHVMQLPRAFGTGMGDGDMPTDQYYSYQDSAKPATTMHAPGVNDGYPFIVGESDWPQWMWRDVHSLYLMGGGPTTNHDIEMQMGYLWHVAGLNTGYDVADPNKPAATGTFNVTDIQVTNTYIQSYSNAQVTGGVKTPSTNKIEMWYSPAVHNFVRKVDAINYHGYEDWGIVKYESKDFGTSNLSVTSQDGMIYVGITITNTLDYATDFNILCLVKNTHGITAACTQGNHDAYPDGKTVFPDVSSIDSINSAIRNTGTLAPGASRRVAWSGIYYTQGSGWVVECGGLNVSW